MDRAGEAVQILRTGAQARRRRLGRRDGRGSLGLLLFLLGDGERLELAAVVAVHGDALTTGLPGQAVGGLDVLDRRLLGEVDGLRGGRVVVGLEGGLQQHVLRRGDVVGGAENSLGRLGDVEALEVVQRAVVGVDGVHQLGAVEAVVLGVLLEDRVDVDHVGVGLPALEGEGEDRLTTTRGVRDDGQGAGGRHGGGGGVADAELLDERDQGGEVRLGVTLGLLGALAEELGEERVGLGLVAVAAGELAAALGELDRLHLRLEVDEAEDLLGHVEALLRAVADAQLEEHAGEAHHAQADLAGALGDAIDLGDRVLVGVDDVVQQVGADVDHTAQALPVDRGLAVDLDDEALEVDRAEVAALVRDQGLLAAGVGRLVVAHPGHRAVLVHAIDEDQAGLAGAPGALHDVLEDLAGVQAADLAAVAGVEQGVVGAGLDGLHEGVGDRDRDVEVGQLGQVFLVLDEVHDVRVVDAQNAHVGAAAHAALLDALGGRVVDVHEGHGARAHALGRVDDVVLGAQAREGEAGAATGLVNEGRVLGGLEDAGQVVRHGQHEAGAELAGAGAGVRQGGRVRQEVQVVGQVVEGLGGRLDLGVIGAVEAVGVGEGVGHPLEESFGSFTQRPAFVFQQVPFFQNRDGVLAQHNSASPQKWFDRNMV
ncbi:hypothetical protein D3C72_822310 [compost metagenome]